MGKKNIVLNKSGILVKKVNIMDAAADPNDRSVDSVFRDFKGRRSAIIRALTTELDEFYQKCDPEKENLCLYGYPTEQWEVNVPVEEVPPEIPEPVLGINFSRDGMPEKDWLLMVAAHSDTWLISAAFYFGARFGFDRASRKRLFNLINDLPTISETVVAFMKKQNKDKSSVEKRGSNNNNNKSKPGSKRSSDNNKYLESANSEDEEDEEEVDEEQENTVCGKCNEYYSTDEFWICCDICETWFHGKCVRISQSKAAHIKQYKCPSCTKKPRH